MFNVCMGCAAFMLCAWDPLSAAFGAEMISAVVVTRLDMRVRKDD